MKTKYVLTYTSISYNITSSYDMIYIFKHMKFFPYKPQICRYYTNYKTILMQSSRYFAKFRRRQGKNACKNHKKRSKSMGLQNLIKHLFFIY